MPDIDSDFCIKKGPLVFKHLNEKYGRENCCNILTFGRLQAKAVIKDIAKCMDISYDEVNIFTKMLPAGPAASDFSIDEIINNPEYNQLPFVIKYPELFEHARLLEGSPRHVSQHPAGIAITPKPVHEIMPVYYGKPIEMADGSQFIGNRCQFEKEQCEAAGLVKLDILKLKNVTELDEEINEINQLYNKNLTLEDIPLDDPKTWNAFKTCNTKGIFQFSSPVAFPILKKMQCGNMEELAAATSLIRPGTDGLDDYVKGKKDTSSIKQLDPRLFKWVKDTYGTIVFQEQIMGLISELMGISFGQADIYRRALEKMHKPANKEKVKYFNDNVVKIATGRGFKKDEAEYIRKLIIDNSGYAFNKCFSGREKIYKVKNQFKSLTIEEMYRIKNDKEYAKQTNHLSLYKKYKSSGYGQAFSLIENGKLIKNNIIDIIFSGVKDVYKVTTESGNVIECTLNHNFPTPNGKKMLVDLKIGDELYVLGEPNKQEYKKLNTIRCTNYPKKGQCGFQKGGTVGTWLFDEHKQKCINNKCESCNNIGKELHHKDGNHDNNVIENFEWLCVSCHKKQHYKMGRTKVYEKGLNSKLSKIISIEYVITENVYDIEMEGPNHNLLMQNGIIASNSHAVCYSYISYYSAWMNVNYPLIFHKTMLNGNLDNLSGFIDLARGDGIELLLPHVNNSIFSTMIESEENKTLRIGFNTINGVGEKAVESIIENKPYASVNDYLDRNNSKATNKKVVESLINSGAFEDMGIEIDLSFVTVDLLSSMGLKIKDNMLYLNRKQLSEWYKLYLEANAPKPIPQYEIQISKIKNKYIQQFGLVTEKDNPNVVVIPETYLVQFELDINDGVKTRKRAKGRLKEMIDAQKIKSDPFTTPFIRNAQDIANIKINILDLYLDEVNKNEFSFLPHPLQKYAKKLTNFKEAADGTLCIEAGIILGMVQRKTVKGKPYYWLMLRTPAETIRITVWDNQYKRYKNIIKQYGLIAVRGIKGFGGMGLEEIKPVTA